MVQVRTAALVALNTRPDAAQSLFDAREAAISDPDVTVALDGALVALGEPAVAPLITGLGEMEWVEDLLVQIGSPAARPLSALLGSTVKSLNCGNGTLEEGAQPWADKHGYSVITTPGSHGGPVWGEGN